MPDFQDLPHSLKLMGFRSAYVVPSWATSITVPVGSATLLRQAIDASTSSQRRVSGYFCDAMAGQVSYQVNRVPGPPQETLTDQELDLQLATLLKHLKRTGTPYETHFFSGPSQNDHCSLLFGLGKGFSGIHFSGTQVWDVLQRQKTWEGTYQKIQIYVAGGGEETYEETALLVSCRNEADLHWLCMALLVFWQEWATVYDTQRAVTYRLVTPLEELRETLYPTNQAHSI